MNLTFKLSKQVIGIVLLSISMLSFTNNDNDADKLVGLWEPSNGRSRIKIEKIGTKYYGKIVWLKEPIDPVTQKAKLDKNNPDTSMRNVPLKGYRILKDFTYNGKKEWSEGTIYDPENGSTYSCVINMKDENVLNIRGFIGIKALGRTDTWKKVTIK
jgi:uncharacterized protein (DUF2147 family)